MDDFTRFLFETGLITHFGKDESEMCQFNQDDEEELSNDEIEVEIELEDF